MKSTVGVMVVVLLGLMGSALWHGPQTFVPGWRSTVEQCVQMVPVLLMALAVVGFVDVLFV